MKNLCLFFIAVLTFGNLSSQTLSRQVFSTIGSFYDNGQMNLSYTLGQPEYLTTDSNFIILTQGFEQPDSKKSIMYTEIIPECDNGSGIDIDVDVLEMCGDFSASVLLDNQPVDGLIQNVQPGTYQLEVICGGINSHIQEIIIENLDLPTCSLIFYSGIAPNGMDENQIWYIENIELFPNNHVEIFDRWGNHVWSGTNYDNINSVWIGENSRGEELPQSTYYYIFKTGELVYKGFIELIR